MKRLFVSTRGIETWRQRLANPDRQWKRKFSAMEAAVSWELAAKDGASGLPRPIRRLFPTESFGDIQLILAVPEHKVALPGEGGASQCDIWAILRSKVGLISLSVEAKAKEPFGNETLDQWLKAGKSEKSKQNRLARWSAIKSHLPDADYSKVRYQLLHRVAAAGIEAIRLGISEAACIVQAFDSPQKSFDQYSALCQAMGAIASRDTMFSVELMNKYRLSVGWADCQIASDEDILATVI